MGLWSILYLSLSLSLSSYLSVCVSLSLALLSLMSSSFQWCILCGVWHDSGMIWRPYRYWKYWSDDGQTDKQTNKQTEFQLVDSSEKKKNNLTILFWVNFNFKCRDIYNLQPYWGIICLCIGWQTESIASWPAPLRPPRSPPPPFQSSFRHVTWTRGQHKNCETAQTGLLDFALWACLTRAMLWWLDSALACG